MAVLDGAWPALALVVGIIAALVAVVALSVAVAPRVPMPPVGATSTTGGAYRVPTTCTGPWACGQRATVPPVQIASHPVTAPHRRRRKIPRPGAHATVRPTASPSRPTPTTTRPVATASAPAGNLPTATTPGQ